MSGFKKKLNEYRIGDDWRSNFKYIDLHNVEESLRSILTKVEYDKVYDRLGNHSGTTGSKRRISYDETVFRIMVLMDTQFKSIADNYYMQPKHDVDTYSTKPPEPIQPELAASGQDRPSQGTSNNPCRNPEPHEWGELPCCEGIILAPPSQDTKGVVKSEPPLDTKGTQELLREILHKYGRDAEASFTRPEINRAQKKAITAINALFESAVDNGAIDAKLDPSYRNGWYNRGVDIRNRWYNRKDT
jgi:hypothetical protein